MTLYVITGNKQKFREIQDRLPSVEQLDIDLPEIQSLDPEEIIEYKLNEARKQHDGTFIVDDTSFSLDALNGLPGPLIKWFLATVKVQGLADIAEKFDNDGAEARAVIGYWDGNSTRYFSGTVRGTICQPTQGNFFGFDCIFKPEGHDTSYAEMSVSEKNAISHRGQALRKLEAYLRSRS